MWLCWNVLDSAADVEPLVAPLGKHAAAWLRQTSALRFILTLSVLSVILASVHGIDSQREKPSGERWWLPPPPAALQRMVHLQEEQWELNVSWCCVNNLDFYFKDGVKSQVAAGCDSRRPSSRLSVCCRSHWPDDVGPLCLPDFWVCYSGFFVWGFSVV